MSLWSALPEFLMFGPWKIPKSTVFYATKLTFAFVNSRPVLKGHMLVSPRRVVPRVFMLSDEELTDLWRTARLTSKTLEKAYPAESQSFTFSIQDGASSGQTVPHVHIHIIPRYANDKFNTSKAGNNAIYDAIDRQEEETVDAHGEGDRTIEDMADESEMLREIAKDISF